jgi:hypothetical protein
MFGSSAKYSAPSPASVLDDRQPGISLLYTWENESIDIPVAILNRNLFT